MKHIKPAKTHVLIGNHQNLVIRVKKNPYAVRGPKGLISEGLVHLIMTIKGRNMSYFKIVYLHNKNQSQK